MMNNSNWRQAGEGPDYRFTLANERTFLAWVRTALAILAAGVLLEQYSKSFAPEHIVVTIAVGLCMLAASLFAVAYFHWRNVELAMRLKTTLPQSPLLGVLAVAGMVASITLVALLIVSFFEK